jgi:hypothetical protein
MIAMFVCDKNSVNTIRVLADTLKAAADFFPAHSRIDEQAHLFGSDERCIAPAATS